MEIFFKKIENDELTFIESYEDQNAGADLWYDEKEKTYYCNYGIKGDGFTDYCNVEKSTNKNELITSVKKSLKLFK